MACRKRKGKTLPGVVVSIGNLTAGGTGKTPAACMLAKWALTEGYRVAILSRGYGGRHKGRVLEVSDGNDIRARPAEAGDEPCLLAKRLKGIPVVVSRKRYFAGLYAHERFGSNFFVLDDGFQHLDLHRSLDLVLMDASNPFGNGHLLPWGPLREPRVGLERADAFLITRSGHDGSADGLMDELKREWPGKPVFRSDHVPERIVLPADGAVHNDDFLSGKRVVAFAGIAKPEGLMKTLTDLGADVVSFKGFEDHHPFQRREIQALIDEKESLRADYLLTTEKDWVRIEGIVPPCPDLAYLTIRMDVVDEEEAFFRVVREAAVPLERVTDGRSDNLESQKKQVDAREDMMGEMEKRWSEAQTKEDAFWQRNGVLGSQMERVNARYGPVIREIERSLSADSTILDAGCGPTCSAQLFDIGEKTYLDPLMDSYLKTYSDKLPEGEKITSTAEEIPKPDESFDVAICVNALDHMIHPEKALVEIRRVLKVDGVFMLGIFLHPTPIAMLRRFIEKWLPIFREDAHPYSYTVKTIRDVLEKYFLVQKEIRVFRKDSAWVPSLHREDWMFVCRKK